MRRLIAWTATIDEAIRRVYEARERGGNARLARRFGLAPRAISARAARLGLAPMIGNKYANGLARFTPDELALIEAHRLESIVDLRARLIRAGYTRSAAAIRSVIQRQLARGAWPGRADLIEDRNYLTTATVCAGLGVNPWTVARWIKQQRLRARPLANGEWTIRWPDLREFLLAEPGAWDPRTVDRWFLCDVMAAVPAPAARKKPGRSAESPRPGEPAGPPMAPPMNPPLQTIPDWRNVA